MFLILSFTAVTIFILTYTLGFIILRGVTSLNELESIAFSGLSGITVQASIAYLIFLSGMFERWLYIGLWFALLVMGLILAHRRQRLFPQQTIPKSWLISGLTLLVMLIFIQGLFPVYTGSDWFGDWWMHYDIARFYLGQRPSDIVYFQLYTVVSRTPLFNLIEAFFMAIFGTEFFIYQLTAITTSLAFLPIFLLLVKHNRVSLGILIISLNPFIIRNILYPWPKLLTAGYVLASLYFFLKWRQNEQHQANLLAWGGLTGLAMLTHPSALFYAIALGLDILRTHRWSGIKLILPAMVVTGLVILPWFIWGWLTFGNVMITTSPTIRGYQKGFSLSIWFVEQLISFMATLVPHALLFKIYESIIYLDVNLSSIEAINPILYYYYHVLPGTLTTILLLCFLIGLSWKRYPWVILMIICGLGGGILLQPGASKNGLAPESMVPLTLVGLMIATQFIHRLGRGLQRLILLILLFEFTISRGLHTLMLTFGVIPPDDPNLLLKTEQNLTFVRDIVGSQWPVWATFAASAYLVLLIIGFFEKRPE